MWKASKRYQDGIEMALRGHARGMEMRRKGDVGGYEKWGMDDLDNLDGLDGLDGVEWDWKRHGEGLKKALKRHREGMEWLVVNDA